MKIFDAFPSKYLKHDDLKGDDVHVIMDNVMMEEIKDPKDPEDAKIVPVLYFRGVAPGLILNKTMSKVIALGYGQETDNWRGKPIIMFPTTIEAFGDTMEAIRVKLLRKQDGGPSRPEGRKLFVETSDNPEATAAAMRDSWAERTADNMIHNAAPGQPATEADFARAIAKFRAAPKPRKPTLVRWDLENNEIRAPGPRRDNEATLEHDADGVVWDETEVRKPTKDDGLTLPAGLRVAPKPEPSLKDRLIAEIAGLTSPRDILHWSMSMTAKIGDVLTKDEQAEIASALQAHQVAIMATQMPPVAHQRSMFK
jgi:hypothetical protein